jgi:hypothetical protein
VISLGVLARALSEGFCRWPRLGLRDLAQVSAGRDLSPHGLYEGIGAEEYLMLEPLPRCGLTVALGDETDVVRDGFGFCLAERCSG